MPENLIVEKRNTVAIVTLNRPEVRNAFDDVLISDLTRVFSDIDKDKTVSVMVLAGAGKAFCAGADLNWMKRMAGYGYEDNLKDARALALMLQTLDRMSKPTIARVHGPAYAGGVGLVAACDVAIGSQDAEFCLTEVKLGLSPATISPYVVRAMGERLARRYFLTGEVIDAGEAYRLRLLSDVCPPDELDGAVNAILGHLVVGGRAAHAEIKDLVRTVATGAVDDAMIADTAKRIAEIRVSPEGREGIASFLEKRKPSWVKDFEAVRVKPPRKKK
jgi:methylglutaconyl-CoA hydratase